VNDSGHLICGVFYADSVLQWPDAVFPVVMWSHLLPCVFFGDFMLQLRLDGWSELRLAMSAGSPCEEVILIVALPWDSLLVCSSVL
jgi:hypothetical protein